MADRSVTVLLPLSLAETPAEVATMRAFAERIGASLALLHVGTAMLSTTMPMVTTGVGFPGGLSDYVDPGLVQALDHADAQAFQTFCDTHFPDVADRRLRHGDPAMAIVEEARNGAIDAIVMGHHRHGLLERLMTGSVARTVLEHAPCPIIVVPAGG